MPEVGNHQCVFDLLASHLSFFHSIQVGSNEKVESLTKSSRVIGFVSFPSPLPFVTIGYILFSVTTHRSLCITWLSFKFLIKHPE